MKYIRISPNVEYSTDTDFFIENQIICIVSKEGTKFCSLIENRLFMRSENRHISERMHPYLPDYCINPVINLSEWIILYAPMTS